MAGVDSDTIYINQEMKNREWYENWFDSPYYHILYKNRNNEEARRFIDNLLSKLNIEKG